MTWFLVVLFLTAGGELEVREGWKPLEQPNHYVCVESVGRVIDYLNSVGIAAVASCQLMPTKGENV